MRKTGKQEVRKFGKNGCSTPPSEAFISKKYRREEKFSEPWLLQWKINPVISFSASFFTPWPPEAN
jgi:hypothetical protein